MEFNHMAGLGLVAVIANELFFMEDDDDDEMETLLKNMCYAEDIVPRLTSRQFKCNFRVDPTTFEIILNKIRSADAQLIGLRPLKVGHPELALDKQLMMTLWVLANQEAFRSVANRFEVARSTAWGTVYRVCKKMIALCINEGIIKWPSTADARLSMHEFARKTNFPGVVGAIDGSHIPIKAPTHSPCSYINRKGYPSLLLHAICDHKMYFLDCYAGEAGSIHDQCLFRRSPIYKAMEEGIITFPDDGHIIGDAAYSLTTRIIPPFKDNGNLTMAKKNFNYTHASCRSVIERSFAFLKGRFRRLKHLENTRLDLAVLLITTGCILHNICVLEADTPDIDICAEVQQEMLLNCQHGPMQDVRQQRTANDKRNDIANSLPMRLRTVL